MTDLAFLVLRATLGPLIAAHGSQKLFGWFEGPGLQGMAGGLESMNLRPGRPWALAAALSEFGGGALTALGFLNPIGPLGVIGAMGMATAKVHWGKPIWASAGGPELPLTNISQATAIMLAGPGKFSLDGVLGIQLPRWIAPLGLAAVAAGVAYGTRDQWARKPAPNEQAGADLQAGAEAARAG
jgi:putative oxidoreductase